MVPFLVHGWSHNIIIIIIAGTNLYWLFKETCPSTIKAVSTEEATTDVDHSCSSPASMWTNPSVYISRQMCMY